MVVPYHLGSDRGGTAQQHASNCARRYDWYQAGGLVRPVKAFSGTILAARRGVLAACTGGETGNTGGESASGKNYNGVLAVVSEASTAEGIAEKVARVAAKGETRTEPAADILYRVPAEKSNRELEELQFDHFLRIPHWDTALYPLLECFTLLQGERPEFDVRQAMRHPLMVRQNDYYRAFATDFLLPAEEETMITISSGNNKQGNRSGLKCELDRFSFPGSSAERTTSVLDVKDERCFLSKLLQREGSTVFQAKAWCYAFPPRRLGGGSNHPEAQSLSDAAANEISNKFSATFRREEAVALIFFPKESDRDFALVSEVFVRKLLSGPIEGLLKNATEAHPVHVQKKLANICELRTRTDATLTPLEENWNANFAGRLLFDNLGQGDLQLPRKPRSYYAISGKEEVSFTQYAKNALSKPSAPKLGVNRSWENSLFLVLVQKLGCANFVFGLGHGDLQLDPHVFVEGQNSGRIRIIDWEGQNHMAR